MTEKHISHLLHSSFCKHISPIHPAALGEAVKELSCNVFACPAPILTEASRTHENDSSMRHVQTAASHAADRPFLLNHASTGRTRSSRRCVLPCSERLPPVLGSLQSSCEGPHSSVGSLHARQVLGFRSHLEYGISMQRNFSSAYSTRLPCLQIFSVMAEKLTRYLKPGLLIVSSGSLSQCASSKDCSASGRYGLHEFGSRSRYSQQATVSYLPEASEHVRVPT